MKGIKNQQPKIQQQVPTKAQENNASQQLQQSGKKSVFAKQLKKKTGGKQTTTKDGSLATLKDDSKGSLLKSSLKTGGGEALLRRQGPMVYGRKGGGNTLADLQAKLDGSNKGIKSEAKPTLMGADQATNTDTKGAQLETGDKRVGQDDLQMDNKLDQLTDDKADLSAFQVGGNPAMQKPMGISQAPQTVQINGSKIPIEMMDKIMDHARLGVNSTGAPEFQFQLKGDVLGGMKMRMSMEDGQLKAIFVAENPDVRKFIDGNLQDLRKALEDRGIHIKDLEIRDPEEDRRQQQQQQNQKEREEAWDQ